MNSNQKRAEFTHKIEENQGIIHKICNMYCDNADDKKDMMQEITLQLWRSYESFQGQSKFSTWMYRVAFNTAITNFRKSKRHPIMEVLFEEDVKENSREAQDDLDEDVRYLYKAIDKLNEIEKAITILYLEEKSYKEIGEIVGINEKNVGVNVLVCANILFSINSFNLLPISRIDFQFTTYIYHFL